MNEEACEIFQELILVTFEGKGRGRGEPCEGGRQCEALAAENQNCY